MRIAVEITIVSTVLVVAVFGRVEKCGEARAESYR